MEPVKLPKFTSGRRDLNPGPPNSNPFSELMAVRSEGIICPLPRNQFATGIGYYGFCWGLVGDCEMTTVLD